MASEKEWFQWERLSSMHADIIFTHPSGSAEDEYK